MPRRPPDPNVPRRPVGRPRTRPVKEKKPPREPKVTAADVEAVKAAEPKRAKMGRPEFAATVDERAFVEVLVMQGMPVADIARAIGASEPTLRKHFAEELRVGRSKRLAEVLFAQYRAAIGGNVSAQNAIRKKADATDELTRVRDIAEERAQPAPKLGKKEIAEERAREVAVGRYAPPPPPRLVVDNHS